MNKLNHTHLLLFLLSVLVLNATRTNGMTLGEALSVVAIVAYCGLLKYVEVFKAKDIDKNFEDRIKNIESKLTFMTASGRIMNRQDGPPRG